jgi:hypothetical protein
VPRAQRRARSVSPLGPPRAAARGGALLTALALAVGAPRAGRAQPQSVQVIPPQGGDTLRSVTPTFVVQAVGAGPGPLRYRFELDTTGRFVGPVLDTLITSGDSTITVRPTRPLGPGGRVFWRATVLGPSGAARSSPVGGPRIVPQWVTPVLPLTFPGAVVFTRRPTFIWSSPQVDEPPGPWEYELELRNRGNTRSQRTRDTVLTLSTGPELETNAAYQWAVTARLPGVGRGQVVTSGSFSVLDTTEVPSTTLLYQNFPNPFPSTDRTSTCVWVDIARPTRATLEIYTLRGMRVRRLLPNPALGEDLAPRRYGRPAAGDLSGCDPNVAWDGTDDRGERLPAGVYLVRFRADGIESVKKLVFRGGG